MKYIDDTQPIENPASGQPLKVSNEPGAASITPSWCVTMFLQNAWVADQKRTMQEDEHAFRILKAVRKMGKMKLTYLALEDADYDFLITTFMERGTKVFPSGGGAYAIMRTFRNPAEEAPEPAAGSAGNGSGTVVKLHDRVDIPAGV